MPQQQLDNDNRVTGDIRAILDQRRERVTAAVRDAAIRHAAEQQELMKGQDDLVRNMADPANGRVASVLAAQRTRLEQLQESTVGLINQALAASSRLDQNGAERSAQALQILNQAAALGRDLIESSRVLQDIETNQLKEALAVADTAQRDGRIDELIRNQKRDMEVLNRDVSAGRGAIARNEALAGNTLASDAIERLRASMMEATKNETLRRLFSSESLQRLANEALVPGREALRDPDRRQTIERVKGDIAEQIAAIQITEELTRENRSRTEQQKLYLVAGDRIRDEMGKLTDGLILWRDQNEKLRLWAAIEVKAGPEAARELNNEKLKNNQDAAAKIEKQKYQRDAGEEVNLVNSGQLNQTAERIRMAVLDDGGRLYLEGRAADVRIDRERQSNEDFVRAYVTDDAIRSNRDVQRLGVTSQDLNAVARAFVDELLRERRTA